MSDSLPSMTARQLGFFSEWYVEMIWPDGRKRRVDGFSSQDHALKWIEHERASWPKSEKPSGG
jgi:hypothetical protein